MSRASVALIAAILLGALLLRGVWLTADPPTTTTMGVGVVWHDEGAWVHNARNRALWGVWRTDNWNPVFLTPVFTGLEYATFEALGVGTWQARVVPVASGLVAIAFLMAGLNALAGRRAALVGGVLLATNYAFVMWNRAALMESTMTAFIAISWGAYALARRPAWAVVAGIAAVLAFLTKASAAFFVAALVVEAVGSAVLRFRGSESHGPRWTLLGLVLAGTAAALLFVLPHWSEFRFYNWQMSVARKPEYTIQALAMRASWLPLVHDFFTWMWPILIAASLSIVDIATRVRTGRPAERLLVLWVLVGLLELVVHDSGNERRYVMFLPAFIALGVLWLCRIDGRALVNSSRSRWLAAALVLGLGYLVAGSGLRVLFLNEVRAGHLHTTVTLAAAASAAAAAAVLLAWRTLGPLIANPRVPSALVLAVVLATVGFDLGRFVTWARMRQTLNYQASVELGRILPPGTLVHGKLANGLSLENRIGPVFIGHEFGNYDDRLQRDDVRYILTYVSPSVGFESQARSGLIKEILDRYPHHRTVATFAVAETGGPDRAALVDKFPGTDARAPD